MFPTLKAFLVDCRTGCSCCSYENHYRGPFRTREEAEQAVKNFRAQPLLASQYSAQGVYDIEEVDAEELPDGRVILDNHIVVGWWGPDEVRGWRS